MPALPMTFACSLYDRMLALQTGDIKPDGIDLNFLVVDNPREIFDRMSNRLEFDACEMSSSEYVSRLAAKKLPFVALPVFASRVFRHGFIVVNRGSSPRPRISPASASAAALPPDRGDLHPRSDAARSRRRP
jgi:4,5-dihydroxyphthalate decarboxylase